MQYVHWLILISLFFALAERIRPARKDQPVLRRQLWNDLLYVGFNGHLYALLTAGATSATALAARDGLASLSLLPANSALHAKPLWFQFAVYLVVSDFLQWCVHNLLHRVPALWQIHKVHHSAAALDWAANLRFHWVELVVYRSLLYVPLLFLGGDEGTLLAVAVFATAWGHFNHSNLDVGIGPLKYVFNSPRMHLWHHDASDEGGPAKNFGIVFSLWDWLFGTVYWPVQPPHHIGYPGDEEMPANWLRQELFHSPGPSDRIQRLEPRALEENAWEALFEPSSR